MGEEGGWKRELGAREDSRRRRNGSTETETYAAASARVATRGKRMHTYAGAEHIKFEGGARSLAPSKNKKRPGMHKQGGRGCSNLKRSPGIPPSGAVERPSVLRILHRCLFLYLSLAVLLPR